MKWINPTDVTTGSGTDSNSVNGTCTWGGAAPGRQQECNQARLHPKPWPQNSATSNAPLSPLCTLQGFHSSSSGGKFCTHWITFAAGDYVRACLCTAWPPTSRSARCALPPKRNSVLCEIGQCWYFRNYDHWSGAYHFFIWSSWKSTLVESESIGLIVGPPENPTVQLRRNNKHRGEVAWNSCQDKGSDRS